LEADFNKANELSIDQESFDPQAPAVMESAFCDPYLDLVDDAELSARLSHFVEADHQFANFPSTVQNPLRYYYTVATPEAVIALHGIFNTDNHCCDNRSYKQIMIYMIYYILGRER